MAKLALGRGFCFYIDQEDATNVESSIFFKVK